jgi:hypothetical protein
MEDFNDDRERFAHLPVTMFARVWNERVKAWQSAQVCLLMNLTI